MTVLVFLKSLDLSDAGALKHGLQAIFPDATIGTDDLMPPYLFREGECLCVIMHVGAPAPLQPSDPEIKNARLWPSAWGDIRAHRSHLIVTVAGGSDPVKRALLVQRLLAAIFQSGDDAIGTVCPQSGALLPRKAVLDLVVQSDQVGIPLFISCFFANEKRRLFSKSGILCSTKGLSQFNLTEVEARRFAGTVANLHLFVFGFCSYLITSRPDIRDGHTIGISATQKIPVKIERSLFYPDQIYSLQFATRA
ncbi:protein of unknown function [Rhizobium sp. RU35A]|uniref:DUF4261 domain-containing protein n=1 Tax=Rhizobium sp. RU35A TaxID=1907414 RepID=UPI0009550598|nr:DUF4261 domain-containing protein [Rhizobium sp. RU35A]SIR37344.1 protein of unknown function [Rhizobium sp. RU35A]